jgi:hypothetical protein
VPDELPNVQVNAKRFKYPNFKKTKLPDFKKTPLAPEENGATINPPEPPKPPLREPAPLVNAPRDPWADYVPSPIPEELQGLIDAYVGGRPFNLFVARSRLHIYWNLALPEEFGFVMLGFFRVLSVQVRFLFPFRSPFYFEINLIIIAF